MPSSLVPTSVVFRRTRTAIAVGATALAVGASLLTAPIASAKPIGAPIIGGGNDILGAGCFYQIGVRVGAGTTNKPEPATSARPVTDKEKADKERVDKAKKDKADQWVEFWELQSPGEPGAKGSIRIGRAKPNANGVAIVGWTPRRTGFRSVYARQQGAWSQPRQVTVNDALSVGRLCLLRWW